MINALSAIVDNIDKVDVATHKDERQPRLNIVSTEHQQSINDLGDNIMNSPRAVLGFVPIMEAMAKW
jgi:hypothetical protein